MSNKVKYAWQGEPVQIQFGQCKVVQNDELPFMWYHYDIYLTRDPNGEAYVPAIRVTTQHGSSFCIANHFRIGERKLKAGGWPDHCHFSLPEEGFQETSKEEAMFMHDLRWNEERYAEHEAARDEYFKEYIAPMHPDIWRKMEACKAIVMKSQRRTLI